MTGAEERPSQEFRGGLFMIASALMFTLSFTLVKDLTFTLPNAMIVFLRSAFALMCCAPMLVLRGPSFFATRRPLGHLWRSTVGFLAYFMFVVAISVLPMGDTIAIGYTQPLWSLLFGVVLFGERLNWRLGAAVVAGGAGVILIANPTGAMNWGVGVALLNALCSALAMAAIKRISDTEPADRITFYFTLYGTTLGGLAAALFDWRTPNLREWIELAISGVFFYGGQQCMTRAYVLGRLSRMAPLDFARLPVAILIGFFWFAEIPAYAAAVGMALIAGAAASIMLEARRRER